METTQHGGYVLAGYTDSYGPDSMNFLVLKLGPQLEYPGCPVPCSLQVGEPAISAESISVDVNPYNFRDSSLVLTVSEVTPESLEVCEPQSAREGEHRSERPLVIGVSGGVLVPSLGGASLSVYSVDGRLVSRVSAEAGGTVIPLKSGIYVWRAGLWRGRVVVR